MHDLNTRLLALDELDLLSAQHLEGGQEAQLHIRAGGRTVTAAGTFDPAFDDSRREWPLPNVLGVKRKGRD